MQGLMEAPWLGARGQVETRQGALAGTVSVGTVSVGMLEDSVGTPEASAVP